VLTYSNIDIVPQKILNRIEPRLKTLTGTLLTKRKKKVLWHKHLISCGDGSRIDLHFFSVLAANRQNVAELFLVEISFKTFFFVTGAAARS
jgi:hypothetical protein